MVTLFLARHGETAENVAQILQGHLPGRLTPLGRQQAEELRCRLVAQGAAFDALVASDLQRAVDTARIVNEAFGLPVQLCSLLRERDWGSLTGLSVTKARQGKMLPDVESVEALFCRARRFLIYIKEHFDGQCVLAIGHGLFCRCILAALAGCEIRDIPRIQNAEVRQVTVDELPATWNAEAADTVSAD